MSEKEVRDAIDRKDPDLMEKIMAEKGLHINAVVAHWGGSALHYAARVGS